MSYGITYMMVGTSNSPIPNPAFIHSSHPANKIAQIAQLSGLAFGLSVAGAIFLNLAQNQLTVLLPTVPKDQIQQLISGTSGALFSTLGPDDRHQALVILVNSLRTTYVVSYPFFPSFPWTLDSM